MGIGMSIALMLFGYPIIIDEKLFYNTNMFCQHENTKDVPFDIKRWSEVWQKRTK